MEKGTKVIMVNCIEADENKSKIWTTSSDIWDMCGSQLVKLEGYRSGFDVSKLQIVETIEEVEATQVLKDIISQMKNSANCEYGDIDFEYGQIECFNEKRNNIECNCKECEYWVLRT